MFDWFYKNSEGIEYMNLLHCAMGDYWVAYSIGTLCIAVFLTYLLIARESYIQGKLYNSSITKTYLQNNVRVFILCGLTYVFVALSLYINLYKLRLIVLGILLYYSILLYNSVKNRGVIARIYEGEKLIEQKLLHYKLTKDKWGNIDDEGDNLIKYKDQLKVEFNKWIDVNNGVKYMRIYHPDYEAYYITEMNPEKTKSGIAYFSMHWHDSIEYCNIKEGHLIEMTRNFKEYEKGENVIYKPFEKHKPVANKFSIYEVGFGKPEEDGRQ